jgi:hypothetical protein
MADKITFIRSADGVLYALSDDQLAPFKVAEDKQTLVDDILNKAKEDCKAIKLSTNVVTQIQQVNGCVKTTAQSPEVHTNTKK